MKKLIAFPSIEPFRSIVFNINRRYNFVGLDENGDAIYDTSMPKPTLTFKGTVKLHGTNSCVSYNNISGMWSQSRENIITPIKDNAGFAFFVEANKENFKSLVDIITKRENIDLDTNTISIYGEWAGKGIQKNVAVNEMPKSMFIFGVKISPFNSVDEDVENGEKGLNKPNAYWVDHSGLSMPESRIYNILDYKTFSVDIDFNNPKLIEDHIIELTMEVEKECPVSKEFGISGVGEGIVFSCEVDGIVHRFKSKGELHSVSNSKKIVSVDVEKLESINEFIEYAVTENRVNQAIENIFPNNTPLDIKKMGDVLRWVTNDVIKEETDTMINNGLEPKEVNKYISAKAKEIFMKRLNTFA